MLRIDGRLVEVEEFLAVLFATERIPELTTGTSATDFWSWPSGTMSGD